MSQMLPIFLFLTISCSFNAYHVEMNEKSEFLEKIQNEILQKDLKKVLQVLPEGVMIFKKEGNRHIKLWNNELVRLFNFRPLSVCSQQKIKEDKEEAAGTGEIAEVPHKDSQSGEGDGPKEALKPLINDVGELDRDHLQDILNQKVLVPF